MADPAHRARAALTNYNYYIFLFKADPAHRARAARRAPHGRGPAAPREAADLGSISARSRLGLATGDAPPRRCRRRGVRRAGGCRGSSLGRLEDAAFVSLSGVVGGGVGAAAAPQDPAFAARDRLGGGGAARGRRGGGQGGGALRRGARGAARAAGPPSRPPERGLVCCRRWPSWTSG